MSTLFQSKKYLLFLALLSVIKANAQKSVLTQHDDIQSYGLV